MFLDINSRSLLLLVFDLVRFHVDGEKQIIFLPHEQIHKVVALLCRSWDCWGVKWKWESAPVHQRNGLSRAWLAGIHLQPPVCLGIQQTACKCPVDRLDLQIIGRMKARFHSLWAPLALSPSCLCFFHAHSIVFTNCCFHSEPVPVFLAANRQLLRIQCQSL